jgi:hypothetical protein
MDRQWGTWRCAGWAAAPKTQGLVSRMKVAGNPRSGSVAALSLASASAGSSRSAAASGQDITAVASALTWLGERLYYLAATSTPPFDSQDNLINTLVHVWTSVLYQA